MAERIFFCEECRRSHLPGEHGVFSYDADPVVPSAAASGPNPAPPATPASRGPDADPMAPLRTFMARGAATKEAVDQAVRAAPASVDPIPFARLRAEADLLLAMYLLEHPKARPTQISAIELIGWAASKG